MMEPDIIHTSHGAFRADRWSLGIVHPNKYDPCADRVFFANTLDCFLTRKSHVLYLRF